MRHGACFRQRSGVIGRERQRRLEGTGGIAHRSAMRIRYRCACCLVHSLSSYMRDGVARLEIDYGVLDIEQPKKVVVEPSGVS